MDDADEANADSPRARLYRVVARLLHLHERRDTLAGKNAEAEQDMGAVPADLLISLGNTEGTLRAVEAQVLEAAYAVIVADRLSSTVQRDEDDT